MIVVERARRTLPLPLEGGGRNATGLVRRAAEERLAATGALSPMAFPVGVKAGWLETPPPDAPNELAPQGSAWFNHWSKETAPTRGASSSPLQGEADEPLGTCHERAHPHRRGPARRAAGAGGDAACGAGRVVSRRSRRDAVHRRRVGLRQDADGARRHGPAARPRQAHGGAAGARGPRPRARQRARHVRHPRQPHGDDLPGADDLAQPGLHHRQPARGGAAAPSPGLAPARRASAPSTCSSASASRRRRAGSSSTRTSSPAACASA